MLLIENVRESFESVSEFIPMNLKIQYLNLLMELGYYSVDLGIYSLKGGNYFSDLEEVISTIDKKNTRICVKVEKEEDFQAAINNSQIDEVEIPFSLIKKLNDSLVSEWKIIAGFSIDFTLEFDRIKNEVERFLEYCISNHITKAKFYNLSENLNEEIIKLIFKDYKKEYPEIGFGAHFYLKEKEYRKIFDILYEYKCQFLEVSINGWGRNQLGATLPTEKVITYMTAEQVKIKINPLMLESAYNMAKKIFSRS